MLCAVACFQAIMRIDSLVPELERNVCIYATVVAIWSRVLSLLHAIEK